MFDIQPITMTSPIIIIGASGHAAVAAEAAKAAGREVLGFVADCPSTCGFELMGDESALPGILAKCPGAQLFVAIGDNHVRRTVAMRLSCALSCASFATIIHPSAIPCEGSILREGSFIAAGAVVGVGATVGPFAIVNTHASLDHHASLGDFASLSPMAATGGRAVIGPGTVVGMGAMVHQNVRIGSDTVLGSLSLANCDLPDRVVACGNPARVIKARRPGDRYL